MFDYVKINWKDVSNAGIPWVSSFSRIMKSVAPPPFDGPTILISSDYSGDLSKFKYSVFSILLVDLHKIKSWDERRHWIRRTYLNGERTMSFKGLNDKFKRDALPQFLNAADFIDGLLVNIAVSKELKDISYSTGLYNAFVKAGLLKSKWHTDSFEKAARLTHFIALLIAGISKQGQNIYWYSDEDNLFSTPDYSLDVAKLLSHLSSFYNPVSLGELGIGTTKLNEKDFFEEDLNSIPDLCAGSLSEFFDKAFHLTDQNPMKNFAQLFPKGLATKTNLIIDWLSNQKQQLKKVTVVFDRLNKGGAYKIWRFDTFADPRYLL